MRITKDVAVIGMSGRFPEAANISEFFENLKNGRDSLRSVSARRKKNTTIPTDHDYDLGGYMEDIDLFDHDFFRIAKGEAICMDPRQRLLLEVAYETFENAGYNVDFFNGSDTAVFIADTDLDYFMHAEQYDNMLVTGNMNALAAGRIARFFNLRGTAEMIDTGCSSSMIALHHACNELILGNAKYVLCGGANLFLQPGYKMEDSIGLDIRSADGKVRAFSAEASGTAGGEAVICVLLKLLDDAVADNDIIHAVIRSVAVNQDGALSASLTAPDSIAQAQVIMKAWEKAGVDPTTITYIEAHGTGTKLGDPIEIEGIDTAFRSVTGAQQFCAVSSVKTNIGHTNSCAGMAGLIKAVLSLKYGVLFPSLHFDTPNPFIAFGESAVYINTVFKPWERPGGGVRRAGVSSFSLMGTNCHAVLEEAPAPDDDPRQDGVPHLITLSANSLASLRSNAAAFVDHLRSTSASIGNISYTLNLGRKHHRYRLALVAGNKEDIISGITAQLKNSGTPEPVHTWGRIFFAFPDGAEVPRELIDHFSTRYPLFASCREACDACAGPERHHAAYRLFLFQYCFYRLLESKGARNKYLIGDGIGKYVIAVLKQECSLQEGIVRAMQHSATETGRLLRQRLEELVKKESVAGPVLFVGMGPGGNISREITALTGEGKACEAITLTPFGEDLFLAFIQRLFLADFPLNWADFYKEDRMQRVELPAYQFDRKRCWLKDPQPDPVDGWFYHMQWIPEGHSGDREIISGAHFLVVKDEHGLADDVIRNLERSGNGCIVVTLSEEGFRQVSAREFAINAANGEDYFKVARALQGSGTKLKGILHLANYRPFDPVNSHSVYEDLSKGFLSQFQLVKAFYDHLSRNGFNLLFVSNNAQKTGNDDSLLMPTGAMSATFLKAVLAECPTARVKAVDLAYSPADTLLSAERVVDELFTDDEVCFVGYRQATRFVPRLTPLCLTGSHGNPIKRNGIYIVTGGASGIGLEVCKSLAAMGRCHLIVIGRKALPEREKWDECHDRDIADVIAQFRQIEKEGSRLEYFPVDVGQPDEMRRFFSGLKERFTKIDGVIHAAGVPVRAVPVKDRDVASVLSTLHPKVQGTLLLAELTRDLQPDLLVLFSSLSAIVPQKYKGEYAVANAFEDAFAAYMNGAGIRAISINWPGWSETGMSYRAGISSEEGPLRYLSTADGISAFHRILGADATNVAVADIDLSQFAVNPFFRIGSEEDADVAGQPGALHLQESADISPTAKKVLQVWYDVLKSEKISPDDDFFELGGHSLNGVQVINKLSKEFGIELDTEIIFDYSTVHTLAGFIDGQLDKVDVTEYESISVAGRQDTYELSHGQRRLWFFEQLAPGSLVYVIADAFKIKGGLNVDALKKAFDTLILRHEILRTSFIWQGDEPRQIVHEPGTYSYVFGYDDLADHTDKEEIIAAVAEKEVKQPFDLGKGPLLRVRVCRTGTEEHVLYLSMHHIITDNWSFDIMLYELMALYNSYSGGQSPSLAPLRIQYKDYAAWQNRQLSSGNFSGHRDFWREYLKGPLPLLALPVDFERSRQPVYEGAVFNFSLDEGISSGLRKLSLDNNTTLFVSLFAVFNVLLYRYTGQQDLLLGTPVAGRKHADLDSQIGFYINTVLMRTTLDEHMSFLSVLQQVRENALQVFAHDIYPFDKIIEDINYKKVPGREALIDAGFSWNKEKAGDDVEVGFMMERLDLNTRTAKYDLWLYGVEAMQQINLAFEYNISLFKISSVSLFAARFVTIAEQVASNPRLTIGDIDFEPGGGYRNGGRQDESIDDAFNFSLNVTNQ